MRPRSGGETIEMNFASDNTTGVAPEIMDALQEANHAAAPPYGTDPWTTKLEAMLTECFERPVAAFPVATGTAANALALGTLCPPFGAVYCHETSHIHEHQCAAPEFYTGGAKLLPVAGPHGKLDPDAFEAAFGSSGPGDVHRVRPAVLSLTQATEMGTIYTRDETAALATTARERGLHVQMDGARFANALAALGCTPAEATWRAGVDVLCLGATKNGAMAAEVVIFFDPAQAETFSFRRKRGGHLFSKMRFLSAQLIAYLVNDRWLRYARHANAMATRLAKAIQALDTVRLLQPVDANMLFAEIAPETARRMADAGYVIETWPAGEHLHTRMVTAFDTRPEDVDGLVAQFRDPLISGGR